MKNSIFFFLLIFVFLSCEKKENEEIATPLAYAISEGNILKKGEKTQFIGANTFHSFGVGSSDMTAWDLDIAREFIGNIKENPITGNPIQDTNGSYLHSLQSIVDDNRLNNKVTILCPFGWNGNSETLFTGKSPTQTFWWNDYKEILKTWAIQFKSQPDVWIEVWNEPYRYDRSDEYTDIIWENDMNELVNIIRTNQNDNIILIPCAEQGQDESVLIHKGEVFLADKTNILFDIHAYEKWLLVSNSEISNRLNQLKTLNLPVFFGEVAPMNAGVLMNPSFFLNTSYDMGLSVCAWVWKYDGNDQDALLTSEGLPNNNNNNNWGSLFQELASRVRQ